MTYPAFAPRTPKTRHCQIPHVVSTLFELSTNPRARAFRDWKSTPGKGKRGNRAGVLWLELGLADDESAVLEPVLVEIRHDKFQVRGAWRGRPTFRLQRDGGAGFEHGEDGVGPRSSF